MLDEKRLSQILYEDRHETGTTRGNQSHVRVDITNLIRGQAAASWIAAPATLQASNSIVTLEFVHKFTTPTFLSDTVDNE